LAKTPTPPALAPPTIDLEERTLDLRLRLKGKAAIDVTDNPRAYAALNGDPIEASPWSNRSSPASSRLIAASRPRAGPIRLGPPPSGDSSDDPPNLVAWQA
jgi:hypothetical protein